MSDRILITGAAGFVGTAFRRWLHYNAPAADVTTVDIKPSLGWVVERESHADVRAWFKANAGFTPGGPNEPYDLVIHLAAVVGGRATIDREPMQVATDLAIDADFWQWVLHAQPRTVVYFSSSAAYPTALQTYREQREYRQLREDDIQPWRIEHPDAIYGLVKLVGEQQARHVAKMLPETQVFVVRPFSGYGHDQALDYPVPSIVRRAIARENPITVWSDTYRDFVHIDDVVGAVMAAVRPTTGPLLVTPGEPFAFNVSSGVGTSFVRLAKLAARLVGYEADVKVLDGMPTGVWWRVGDPDRMRKFYTPRIDLGDGIERMIQAVKDTQ